MEKISHWCTRTRLFCFDISIFTFCGLLITSHDPSKILDSLFTLLTEASKETLNYQNWFQQLELRTSLDEIKEKYNLNQKKKDGVSSLVSQIHHLANLVRNLKMVVSQNFCDQNIENAQYYLKVRNTLKEISL